MKGAIELVSTTFLFVAGSVLLLIGVLMLVILFSQFKAEVQLHEHERAANQLAEALVSKGCEAEIAYGIAEEVLNPPNMLVLNSVINASVLGRIAENFNLSECLRFCGYGSGFKVKDKETGKEWYVGYVGAVGQASTFPYPVAIWSKGEYHEGELISYVYPDIISLAACLADKAWLRGSAGEDLPPPTSEAVTSMDIELKAELEILDVRENVVLRNPANVSRGERIWIFKCPSYATFCEVNYSDPILIGSRNCGLKQFDNSTITYFTCEDAILKDPLRSGDSINVSSGTYVSAQPCPYNILDPPLCRLVGGTCLPFPAAYGCCCNSTDYSQKTAEINYTLYRTKLCGSAFYTMPTYEAGPVEVLLEHACRMLYNAWNVSDFIGSWTREGAKLMASRTGKVVSFSIRGG